MENLPPPKCPRCGEDATYQTPDGTYWDASAHSWRLEAKPSAEFLRGLADLRKDGSSY